MPDNKKKVNNVHGQYVDDTTLQGLVDENKDKGPQVNDSGAPKSGKMTNKSVAQQLRQASQIIDDGTKYTIDEKPSGLFKRMKWRREVRKKRRLLRKDLKKNYNIKKWRDFDRIATELGLVYDWRGTWLGRLLWWILYHWAKAGIITATIASLLTLLTVFVISTLTEYTGSFTINLTAAMLENDFYLYNTRTFDSSDVRLFSESLDEVNCITLEDIAKDVNDVDGPHNGRNYLAYTFYLRNDGLTSQSYEYAILNTDNIKNVDKAVWVMLFEDDKQIIYAKPHVDEETGESSAEGLTNFTRIAPFMEYAYDVEKQYEEYEKDHFNVWTNPTFDDRIIVKGYRENVQPGESHKYTVVIWVEGNDPDCTNDMMDGFAKYKMEFNELTSETKNNLIVFQGLYRSPYEEYNPLSDNGETTD